MTAFGPGSASDVITRIVAQPLGVALKQNVIVEARPGANGAPEALYVARAPADGYTLLMTTNSPHSAAPFLMKNVAYDPIKDFTMVTRLGSFTLMLLVHPSIPAKTVKELIDYGKANPGKLHLRQRQHRRRRGRQVRSSTLPNSTCCTCRIRAPRRPSRICWRVGSR